MIKPHVLSPQLCLFVCRMGLISLVAIALSTSDADAQLFCSTSLDSPGAEANDLAAKTTHLPANHLLSRRIGIIMMNAAMTRANNENQHEKAATFHTNDTKCVS